jgi:hypothetical protein
MANTYNELEYAAGEKVRIHSYMFGKEMTATIFSSDDDYWTGAFYSDSSKQVRERSVVLENGRMARVPYHFLIKLEYAA